MLKFNSVTYVSTVLDLFNLNTSYVKVQLFDFQISAY